MESGERERGAQAVEKSGEREWGTRAESANGSESGSRERFGDPPKMSGRARAPNVKKKWKSGERNF